MSGRRYLLDTNAIIYLLQGKSSLQKTLNQATWIGISIISELEFLAFPALSEEDKLLFDTFIKKINVIDLRHSDTSLIHTLTTLRHKRSLKLPDAIIAASALHHKASLITADRAFQNIPTLTIIMP